MKTALILTAAALALAPLAACSTDGGHHATMGDHAHHHADFVSGRFHVRIDGPASPIGDVILVPGLSSSPEVWDALTDQLKDRYRVHRLHVQGFAGAAPKDNATGPVSAPVAEDLARYIAEQGLDKPTVIGHSMGGMIGMMLAARHPDSVGKLMVVDMVPFPGSSFGTPGTNPTVADVTPAVEAMHARSLALTDEQYRAQVNTIVTGMINTPWLRAGPLEDSATSDRTTSSNAYRELMLTDLRPELANIKVPTEVLYVTFNMPGITPEVTDFIYGASFATLPGVRLKRIDDSAHFIMLDQPAVFSADVEAFLAR